MSSLPKCSMCGRFMRTHNVEQPIGWFRYGEYGTEEGFVCALCLPSWMPRDSLGRGSEAGYCGVTAPNVPTGGE